MAEIQISKIKVRRGTNNQRKQVIIDQGELAYTVDTKRLFVGNGVLSGGDPSGSVSHLPVASFNALSTIPAVRGDTAVANSKTYQLTGTNASNISDWGDISLKLSSQFEYSNTNTLTISNSAISAVNIKPETVGSGIKIQNGILQSNFNTKSFEISASQISIKSGGLDEREISSSSFGSGISGGSGNKISLNVDNNYFYFDGGRLSLSSIPVSSNVTPLTADESTLFINNGFIYVLPSGITETEINSESFGDGITGGNGIPIELDVDSAIFSFNENGELTYNNAFSLSSFDPYDINSVFIGKAAGVNALNAESSVFAGLSAGFNSPNAENSVFLGNLAGYNLSIPLESSSTMSSVFIGSYSGYEASTSVFSNFIGAYSGQGSTESVYSNFLGNYAGADSLSALQSNLIGFEAGYGLSGQDVNAIGFEAGKDTKGDNNIFIGSHTSTLSANIHNCLIVGMSAQAIESNTVVLGSTDFQFLTSAVGSSTGLSLVVRLNGTDFTIPLHTRP